MDLDKIYNENRDLINSTSIDFLTDKYIVNRGREISLDSITIEKLLEVKEEIFQNEEAKLLLKAYLSLYFKGEESLKGYCDLSSILLEKGDLFFLLVAIAKINDLELLYKQKGIPDSILYDTLSDIRIWAENHNVKTGNLGLSELHWLRHHLNGELFKIGRLQFHKIDFSGDVMLFKQATTRFPLLLSYGDINYDFLGNKTEKDEEFISTYIESDITITANPIREGKCQRETVTINKCDYSLEIKNGTSLLSMHIQQGEKLDISKCIHSMKEAIRFYYKYFNGDIIKGFTCTSWLLNRNYRYILPDESNIRKFASMFYEYPMVVRNDQMYRRVFNGEMDIEKLIDIGNKTQLQEVIIKGIKEGLTFEDASIIFPSYDMRKLDRFMSINVF
ncbi:acyltransferase domain-containing protein [Clostridium cylindrosporum]|uniref:Uncharacterized protein n=1 Tax=Clostridium cylindrosporum DSM 605 TaxID=1121307 RepID=A0A0J8DCW5_CLOCY|nr:acyltransferase domain-containing protein [Clostridium cylindrosporum]KMT22093.1 hypothetical protein CLCY_4c00660 [Clostridium cylindrosporum DSM 605]